MKRRIWALAVPVLLAAAAAAGVIATSSGGQATPAAQASPPNTVSVERGKLSDVVSLYGTLRFRARSDGSPYGVINEAHGTYTELPEIGDKVACGEALYRVDQRPVVLLCGTVPSYRTLHLGDAGEDVRQLNRNLHALGDDAGSPIGPDDNAFSARTERALKVLEHARGQAVTGALEIGDAVFLPEAVRIAKVAGELGGPAVPGVRVLDATSDMPAVQVALDPSQQQVVKPGDRAQVTLPGNTVVTGTVDRVASVAQIPDRQGSDPLAATFPASIKLDDPESARGFDAAPVRVDITTEGVEDALSVPVIALVGKAGGGFAVEVVRADGRRELVAVKLGLFDTTDGRVEVEGDLVAGDQVVVPSS